MEDKHSYKGWLNSDSFWKRALATYGHALVGELIISLPILVIIGFIALVS